MNKKFLAKLLIFCMVFTMFPMTAFAAGATAENANRDIYKIAWDAATNALVNVEQGENVTVTANVTYETATDTTTLPVAVTYTADNGITVANGGFTVPADLEVGTTITVTANATVNDNGTVRALSIDKTLKVTAAPAEEETIGNITADPASGEITGSFTGVNVAAIDGDETSAIYKVGDDTATVVFNFANTESVKLSFGFVTTLKDFVDGTSVKGVGILTAYAYVEFDKDAAAKLATRLAAMEIGEDAEVFLSVEAKDTLAGTEVVPAAIYEIDFYVGSKDNKIMSEDTASDNPTLTLTVAPDSEALTATEAYVYYFKDGEFTSDGISDETLADGVVTFGANHFSTIVVANDDLEGGNGGGSKGGGGSSSSSNISIATKVIGGTVTTTPSRPSKGQTVTIIVKPADGYKLDTLTVTDRDGKTIELTKVDDTHYTFVMPAGKVTITPTFVKLTDEEKKGETLTFTDVKDGDWFAKYVAYVVEKGMMKGYEDGRFGPNDYTTRAQIVTVLYRLEGEPDTSTAAFSDVSGGQYYSDPVAWAANNSIVKGYETGKFGPSDNVTREQIAAILYRYAEYKNIDTSAAGDITTFRDANGVSDWATDAIAWAVGEGLMNGDNGALRPQGNATCAEIAAMLMRFCENVAK